MRGAGGADVERVPRLRGLRVARRRRLEQDDLVDLEALRGFGADVPVLAGWESDSGIYKGWAGVRGRFERASIEARVSEPKAVSLLPAPVSLDMTRWGVGGLVGVGAGFRYVHVLVECEVSHSDLRGTFGGSKEHFSGLVVTPAAGISWRF